MVGVHAAIAEEARGPVCPPPDVGLPYLPRSQGLAEGGVNGAEVQLVRVIAGQMHHEAAGLGRFVAEQLEAGQGDDVGVSRAVNERPGPFRPRPALGGQVHPPGAALEGHSVGHRVKQ